MPVFNEENGIGSAIHDVQSNILNLEPQSELIIVNDGSTDQTTKILKQYQLKDPRIQIIEQENTGHGFALLKGMNQASGNFFFLMDSDSQIPTAQFPDFWHARSSADLIMGIRKNRKDPLLRIMLSRMIRWYSFIISGVRVNDANIPFKLFPKSLWLKAQPYIPESTLAPSLFLALFASKRKLNVKQIPVEHRPRISGVSSLHFKKLLSFCIKAFRQMREFCKKI